MSFATSWLDRKALFPQLFKDIPDRRTGIIVVVPAFDEPGITILLDSLASCSEPPCSTEVIIIVNAPRHANPENIRNNSVCIANIEKWKRQIKNCFFRLYYFDTGQSSIRDWGAGFARKTGMDEALRRFDTIEKPEGIIVSLDADCTVDKNYFSAIHNDLLMRKERNACSIRFEHPVEGHEFPGDVYRQIILYELHMRYFCQAVMYSGYPYAFQTIGSAIAFRASAYMKAGGMNRRQAGEDFYFIQKLIPQGGYFDLVSTSVHPSPRTSSRVPFGTGAVVSKMLNSDAEELTTYNTHAFTDLKFLFSNFKKLFTSDENELASFYEKLPDGLRSFIGREKWMDKMTEIRNNTSSGDSFVKRFFAWFNMFRIVKYLNHIHSGVYQKEPVTGAAAELLKMMGKMPVPVPAYDLLIHYRNIFSAAAESQESRNSGPQSRQN